MLLRKVSDLFLGDVIVIASERYEILEIQPYQGPYYGRVSLVMRSPGRVFAATRNVVLFSNDLVEVIPVVIRE